MKGVDEHQQLHADYMEALTGINRLRADCMNAVERNQWLPGCSYY